MPEFVGGFLMPHLATPLGTPPTLTSTSLISGVAPRGQAFILRVPKSGTLKAIGALSGSTSAGTNQFRVSVQGVSGGLPNGTISVFRPTAQPASNTWFETGILSDDGTDTGVKLAVTAGQMIAVVFDYSSYVSGSFSMSVVNENQINFPYLAGNVTGAGWSKPGGGGLPNITLKYNDDTYRTPHHCLAVTGAARAKAVTPSSTPDHVGAAFFFPFKCVVDGALVLARFDGIAEVNLYNGITGARYATTTWRQEYGAFYSGSSYYSGAGLGQYYWVSFEPQEFSAGDTAVVAVRETVSTCTVWDLPMASQAVHEGLQGGALMGTYAERTGTSGAFTTDLTRRALMALHLTSAL